MTCATGGTTLYSKDEAGNIDMNLRENTSSISNIQACRIVVAYKTFGPYHIARLAHLARHVRSKGIWLEGLALAGKQQDYPWLEEEGDGDGLGFRNTTLFPGEMLENVPRVRIFKELLRYLRKIKPTVLFTSNYASLAMALLAIGTRMQGGQAVIMSDSTWLDSPRSTLREKAKRLSLMPYTAAFVSGVRAHSYIQHLGIPSERIVTGCDVVSNQTVVRHVTSARTELESPRRDLLCVARLIPKKNHFLLIEAYALYRKEYATNRPLSLVLCGSGPLEQDLRCHANRCGVPDITFTGFVQQPSLFSWFAQARALVLPSVSEQWGLVVNEALAAGLPVLVSERCGCVPELVRAGDTGWSFDPEDVSGLAKLMAQVERLSEQELQRMGAAAEQLISSWDLDRFSAGIATLAWKLG